ncbi:MAG: sulfatase-like hydrolase/transferase, partial [Coriobacteriales bacterium]|nr:sulfatase-like hydrolase/transferase [Coriobacteriales bacterium]
MKVDSLDFADTQSSDSAAARLFALPTKSRIRRIAAALLMVASVVLYCVYPSAFWTVADDTPVAASLFLPLFILCVIASLLLDFSLRNKYLRVAAKTTALLACLLVIFYASEVLISRHFWALLSTNAGAFCYGYGIIVAFCAVFFAFTGSVPWGVRATAILVALYGFTNYFCILFRGSPFVPQDLFGLATAADVASSYAPSFTKEVYEALLAFVGVFCLAPRLNFARLPGHRQWLVRAGALLCALVFFAATVSKPFIVAMGYEPFYFEQWQSADQNGTILNFVANIADSSVQPPEGYSSEAVEKIAARYVSDSVDDAGVKPDVVVILGESWADIVPEARAETSEPVMPFISSLQDRADAASGNLIVSSKGGGTSRQEFQLLTGANDEYGLHTAPFLFLVDGELPSIVQSFKALEYQTIALHTGTQTAWNRDTALPLMGFDTFLSEDALDYEEAPTLRGYLRDSVLYNKALELLDEAAAEDEPSFLYAISIHTHGGYGHEDYEATIKLEEPEGSYAQTEQYLSLLHEADADLEDFIEALEGRKRPTLVLFFGDHLPNFDNSYEEDVLEGSDPLWRYKTLYGLWANYELPETSFDEGLGDDPYLSLSYLNLYLMQSAGLPLTGYQKFLLEGAEAYPVASILGFREPDGTIIPVEEARKSRVYQEQAIMQYSFVYDRAAMPSEFFFLRE